MIQEENNTFTGLQAQVDEWIQSVGVRYFDPLTNMAILTEEVGEVARVMARLYGEQSAKPGEKIDHDRLGDELTDLIWVAIAIANQTGVDLSTAWQRNIDKKNQRDHDRHRNNSKLADAMIEAKAGLQDER